MGLRNRRPTRRDDSFTPDVAQELIKATLEHINELEDDYPEVWEQAEEHDFGLADIRERLEDMSESIEKFDNVTGPMVKAIQNMCKGVEGWYGRRDQQFERH